MTSVDTHEARNRTSCPHHRTPEQGCELAARLAQVQRRMRDEGLDVYVSFDPVNVYYLMPGAPKYTGEFEDGFGNKMTVHAVSNPVATGRKPAKLYDRATGYGIIRLNRRTREIVFEAWPRWVDPTAPDARPYSGWPVTFNQLDNYGKKPSGWLPLLQIRGMRNPVVQVFDEQQKELIYNLRISGREFRPMVFTPGPFTVLVGEPEIRRMQMFNKLTPHASAEAETLRVDF